MPKVKESKGERLEVNGHLVKLDESLKTAREWTQLNIGVNVTVELNREKMRDIANVCLKRNWTVAEVLQRYLDSDAANIGEWATALE